jgi:ribosome biogenesis GTPase
MLYGCIAETPASQRDPRAFVWISTPTGVFTLNSKEIQKVIKGFEKDKRKRELGKSKKPYCGPRETRSPRRKDWLDLAYGDDDFDDFERIMPRDESDRRKAVEAAIERKPTQTQQRPTRQPDSLEGRVVEVGGDLFRVRLDGATLLCSLRGSLAARESGFMNVVAVGDRVLIAEDGSGRGVIEHVLPRQGVIARSNPGAEALQRLVAANVDQLLIVASWRSPHLWPELIDRYLITARRGAIRPLISVNKIDLADGREEVEETISPYRALGCQVFLTSASSGEGVDALREQLTGQITALAGLSGVGKSTLLNAVDPNFDLRTGRTNEAKGQGRHTTTQAVMLPLQGGGYVIDTPGIREFGLVGLRQGEVAGFYPEIAAHAAACQFADCSHQDEPGCAVREAVEAGAISPMRFDSFLKIRASLPA